MSSGANLICELTKTDIFANIKTMLKTAFIPFILTALLYLLIGFAVNPGAGTGMTFHIFSDYYNLSVFTVVPAAVIVAPLMPWSIAVTVPLTSIGAPMAALLPAFFLYLIPLWNMAVHTVKRKRT